MIEIALVGCGQIASDHVAAIQLLEGVRLCAVVDPDEQRRLDVAARGEGVRAYADVTSMLNEERPDAVHVLTPPAAHEQIAVQAMRAGCHVLVEKPIALDVGAVDRMIATAQERGVVLSTCHNMLFKPAVLRARELVEAGVIGKVVHVVGFYGFSEEGVYGGAVGSHWAYRLPGGVFTNFLPHMISLQQAFMGPNVTVVDAVMQADRQDLRRHAQLVVLSKGAEASGVMTISVIAKPDAKFLDVYGTKGTLHVDLVREMCIVQQTPRLPRAVAKVFLGLDHARQLLAGITRSALLVASGRLQGNPGLLLLVRDFYESIQSGRATTPTAEDGRAMVETLESIWSKAPELMRPGGAAPEEGPRTDVESRIVGSQSHGGRALVTGATGFLGSHLVAALSRCDVDVVALIRDPSRTPFDIEDKAQLVVGGLDSQDRLDEAMKGVDVVYHCAAATTSRASWELHHRDTVLGTERVLESALRCGGPRVVHVSSVVVYGLAGSPAEGVDESSPCRDDDDPWAYYQRAKIEAEQRAFHYARDLGLPVTVVRPGILYGPRRPVRAGVVTIGPLVLTLGRGRNRLPFTYVDNAVDCLLLAGSSPRAVGEAFNVVDEPQVSIRTVLATASDARTVLVPVPPRLLRAAGTVVQRREDPPHGGRPPKISDFVIRSACRDITYSNVKAREVLGWQQGVTVEEGLRRSRRQ